MPDKKTTRITLHSDSPVGISSTAFGANADTIGFNLSFLALRKPRLAVEILKLYSEARQVKEDDPQAPDEDMELFSRELDKLFSDKSDSQK